MRKYADDIFYLLGALLITAGAYHIHFIAALFVAGSFCLHFSYMIGKHDANRKAENS